MSESNTTPDVEQHDPVVRRVELIREFADGIYEQGNSHNPEYWTVGDQLADYADRLERTGDVAGLIEDLEGELASIENPWCEHEAPETALAICRGAVESAGCNGCGEIHSVDPEGYCYSCRHLYDNKPDELPDSSLR